VGTARFVNVGAGFVVAGRDESTVRPFKEAKLCAPIIVARVLPVISEMRTRERLFDVSFADGMCSVLLIMTSHRIEGNTRPCFNIDSNVS
jgi:hypothetical protein